MEFEKFIPFLIFIGYAIYKQYANAKEEPHEKEMQKKKEDKPSTWSVPAGQLQPKNKPYEKIGPPPVNKSPFEMFMDELRDIQRPTNDPPIEKPVLEKYKEPKYEQHTVKVVTNESKPERYQMQDLKNIEQMPQEVLRARKQHEKHHHSVELHKEQYEEEMDFDLRDAVIKSIILERRVY